MFVVDFVAAAFARINVKLELEGDHRVLLSPLRLSVGSSVVCLVVHRRLPFCKLVASGKGGFLFSHRTQLQMGRTRGTMMCCCCVATRLKVAPIQAPRLPRVSRLCSSQVSPFAGLCGCSLRIRVENDELFFVWPRFPPPVLLQWL